MTSWWRLRWGASSTRSTLDGSAQETPAVILMVGLQELGKTTSAAKLARSA